MKKLAISMCSALSFTFKSSWVNKWSCISKFRSFIQVAVWVNMDGWECVWMKLKVVNGLAGDSLWGGQITSWGVNLDSRDDKVWRRLLKHSGLVTEQQSCLLVYLWAKACHGVNLAFRKSSNAVRAEVELEAVRRRDVSNVVTVTVLYVAETEE